MCKCMSIAIFENRLRNVKSTYPKELVYQFRRLLLINTGLPEKFLIKSKNNSEGKSFGYQTIEKFLIELGFYQKKLKQNLFDIIIQSYEPNDFVCYEVKICKANTTG